MSDDVLVEYGDSASDTATLLLAAAEKLEYDPGVVRTVEGAFLVPADVADEAGVDYEGGEPKTTKKSAKKTT